MGNQKRDYKYRSIAVGGTFDHFHIGHRSLLARAFETGEKVFIGLTTDEFAERSGKKIDHDFESRKEELESFIDKEFPGRNYEITRLGRSFGPAIFTGGIEALAVSTETQSKVSDANMKRRELGLPDLKVEVVPLETSYDGKRISSSRIRAGEIDLEGHKLD